MGHNDRAGRYPAVTCPEEGCGRDVRVCPGSERVYPHLRDGQRCPGSGVRVDLYGVES